MFRYLASGRWKFNIVIVALVFSVFPFSIKAQMNTTRLLAIGKNALYYEDYIISIQYFNRVIRLKPYLYEPYILRAIAKIRLEDFSGALRDCNEAIERNPYQAGLYYTRGYIYRQMGEYAKAEKDFSQALLYSPENRTYLALRADVRGQLGKSDSAMSDINHLITKEPRSGALHFEKGVICLSQKDTLCALEAFTKATRFDSQNSATWSALGLINIIVNQMDEALSCLNTAIRLGSKWEGDYINRAIIFYHKHNYKAALSDYGKAISINPYNAETYYNRGILRQELGDYNNALDDLDRAIQYAKEVAPYLYQRVLVLLQLQQWEKALIDIDSLQSAYPYFLPSYFLAAKAYSALGLKKEASIARHKAYILEQKRDSIQSLLPKDESDLNTNVHLAKSQPAQRDRRKEFSTRETLENINADETNNSNNFSLRGNIQHKNVDVINENMFFLSYNTPKTNIRQTNYTHVVIDEFNNLHLLPSKLYLTTQENAVNPDIINQHFDQITSLSDKIANYEKSLSHLNNMTYALYFARAFEFAIVQDYYSATEDCTKAILLSPNTPLLYFCRAYWRLKHVEIEKNSLSGDKLNMDLDIILGDYNYCIKLLPDFSFAYYNKANLLCIQKKYSDAITNYTKAIEIDSEFAEAYFNRGLTYIYNNDIDNGIADLSKAGELGIYQAYNLITRFK